MTALRILFVVHGLATLAAGIVLIASPAAIPATVGVVVPPNGNLVAYLLGAMEIGAAVLSLGAPTLKDPASLRLVSISFIAMHLVTCAVELLAYARAEVHPAILANVALRVVVSAAFAWLGVRSVR
jgi:hypothetical protein